MIKNGETRLNFQRERIHGKIDDLDNVDFVFSSVNSSRKEALLYIFEDNEAVIKMIIKGRSSTMNMFQEPSELLWTGCLAGLFDQRQFHT